MEEKFTGFVLHHTPLTASSLVVDFFTLHGGRRQGVLRLTKKDSRALLTPMTCVSFQLMGREHQQLKRIGEVSVLGHCYDLASNYLGLALLCHWGWLIRKTQPEEHAEERIFRLLAHLLPSLLLPSDGERLHLHNLYFEVWLLHFCGVLRRQPLEHSGSGEELSVEERLYSKLDRRLLSLVFQRKIEEYLPLALKLGSLNGTTAVLGTLWERLLDRELKTRQVFYKQVKERGRQ